MTVVDLIDKHFYLACMVVIYVAYLYFDSRDPKP